MNKTFAKDMLIRDEQGNPLGRCVLAEASSYQEGKSFPVVLVKIPITYYGAHDHIYIDENAYIIPKKVSAIRKSTDGINIIFNNVTLEVSDEAR